MKDIQVHVIAHMANILHELTDDDLDEVICAAIEENQNRAIAKLVGGAEQ